MSRLEKVRSAMQQKGIDALLTTKNDDLRYLTGFSGSTGMSVVTNDGAYFLTDSRYTEQAQKECVAFEVRSLSAPMTYPEFMGQLLNEIGAQKVAIDQNVVTLGQLKQWNEKIPGVEFVPIESLLAPLRLVKDPEELAVIRQAVGIVEAAFQHVLRTLQEGAVEYDVGLELEFFLRRQGAEIGFPPIVVSGPNSALPHGHPTERQFQKGDFVTLDFGARFNGYNSDMTRTVVIAECDDEHRRVYEAVLEAQLAALDAMKPGVKASDVDKAARDTLAKHDLAQYFGHGLGHSLGIAVHDGDSLSPKSTAVLEPGQVWTVEPGAYIPGWGGVRIEDDVVVTENGIEILTQTPKKLLVTPC